MIIDIEKITDLKGKGDEIFFTPEGEQVLMTVLEVERQLEEAKDKIKEALEQTALSISPNFRSIEGENVKVYYRAFGSRFRIDEQYADKIPASLVETKTVHTLKPKEVEKWAKEHGSLPLGVNLTERNKQISFKFKNDADPNEQI